MYFVSMYTHTKIASHTFTKLQVFRAAHYCPLLVVRIKGESFPFAIVCLLYMGAELHMEHHPLTSPLTVHINRGRVTTQEECLLLSRVTT